MDKIFIQNDFFTREANPKSELDRALLAKAAPGQTLIGEELDEAARQRQTLYQAEMEQAAYIASRPKAYEREPFMRYVAAFSTLHVITRWALLRPLAPISEELMPMVYDLQEQRKALTPLRDPEEGLWYIWGEEMPHSSVAETADWGMAFDRPDFRPFLIPYLLPDQSAVKGNIVVVSGGAYEWRSNRWEGFYFQSEGTAKEVYYDLHAQLSVYQGHFFDDLISIRFQTNDGQLLNVINRLNADQHIEGFTHDDDADWD